MGHDRHSRTTVTVAFAGVIECSGTASTFVAVVRVEHAEGEGEHGERVGVVELGPVAVLRSAGAGDELLVEPTALELAQAVRERWGRGVRVVGRGLDHLDVMRGAA